LESIPEHLLKFTNIGLWTYPSLEKIVAKIGHVLLVGAAQLPPLFRPEKTNK
jgi:hypothetical protein